MSKRRQLDVGRSCKGVILTCNRQPHEACKEFLNLLERPAVADQTDSMCSLAATELMSWLLAALLRRLVPGRQLPRCFSAQPRIESQLADFCREREGELCIADDVAVGISAELESMASRTKRFQVYSQLLPGVAFIRFTREEDVPSAICHGLLRRALENPGLYSCRHASRVLPVDVCSSPAYSDFAAAARRLCKRALPLSAAALGLDGADGGEPAAAAAAAAAPKTVESSSVDKAEGASAGSPEEESESSSRGVEGEASAERETWACAFSSRGFGTVKKDEVVELLARLVGSKYKVDIKHAKHTLLVEVNPLASVVRLPPYHD
ncbi:hypothetical protein Efla_007461 [Eimeria flavescens]